MMKLLTSILIAMFVSLPALAESKDKRPITAFELAKILHRQAAQRMPKEVRDVPLTHFYVSKKIISFRYAGIYFRFQAVGTADSFIRFNGRDFAAKDFKTEKTLALAFRSKFGIVDQKTKFSWINLLKGRGSAALTDATGAVDEDFSYLNLDRETRREGRTAVGDGVNFEGMDTKEYIVFDEDSAPTLHDTEFARQFNLDVQMREEMLRGGIGASTMMTTSLLSSLALAMVAMEPSYAVIFGGDASVDGINAVGDIPMPRGK